MKKFGTQFRYWLLYQQFEVTLNREALNILSTPVGHSMRQRCDDAVFSLPLKFAVSLSRVMIGSFCSRIRVVELSFALFHAEQVSLFCGAFIRIFVKKGYSLDSYAFSRWSRD